MNKIKEIKIGDTINYRSMFGFGGVAKAKITAIELCERGEKYGTPTNMIYDFEVTQCVFSLDNNTWCRGSQVIL